MEKKIETYHRIVESFKFAYAARSQMGDARYVDMADVSQRAGHRGERAHATRNGHPQRGHHIILYVILPKIV